MIECKPLIHGDLTKIKPGLVATAPGSVIGLAIDTSFHDKDNGGSSDDATGGGEGGGGGLGLGGLGSGGGLGEGKLGGDGDGGGGDRGGWGGEGKVGKSRMSKKTAATALTHLTGLLREQADIARGRGGGKEVEEALVKIFYMTSYAHMGVARLSCEGGCSCRPKDVDAHVTAHETVVHLLRMGITQNAICTLRVEVMDASSDPGSGHKFKIVGIDVTPPQSSEQRRLAHHYYKHEREKMVNIF
jgi:hypothetical protein